MYKCLKNLRKSIRYELILFFGAIIVAQWEILYTFAVSYRISTPKSTGEEEHCKGEEQQRWSAVAAKDNKEKRVF